MVAEGSSVRLNVAEAATPAPTTTEPETAQTTTAAPEPPTVPDVVGEALADAARTFNEEGLKVAVVYVPSNEPAGSVVAQAQSPGTELQSGDTVQLNVSTGPGSAGGRPAVPDVDGGGSRTAATGSARQPPGSRCSRSRRQTTDSTRVGFVLSQTPGAAPASRAPTSRAARS